MRSKEARRLSYCQELWGGDRMCATMRLPVTGIGPAHVRYERIEDTRRATLSTEPGSYGERVEERQTSAMTHALFEQVRGELMTNEERSVRSLYRGHMVDIEHEMRFGDCAYRRFTVMERVEDWDPSFEPSETMPVHTAIFWTERHRWPSGREDRRIWCKVGRNLYLVSGDLMEPEPPNFDWDIEGTHAPGSLLLGARA